MWIVSTLQQNQLIPDDGCDGVANNNLRWRHLHQSPLANMLFNALLEYWWTQAECCSETGPLLLVQ